jgi:ribosomal protein S8E
LASSTGLHGLHSSTTISKIKKKGRKERKKEKERKIRLGAEEMAHLLRAITALTEVLRSTPSKHMVAHNHLYRDLMPSSGVSKDSYSVLT